MILEDFLGRYRDLEYADGETRIYEALLKKNMDYFESLSLEAQEYILKYKRTFLHVNHADACFPEHYKQVRENVVKLKRDHGE